MAAKKCNHDGTISSLDQKVADLKKKLNKLKFESGNKTKQIEIVMREYETVLSIANEQERMEDIFEESVGGQRLRFIQYEVYKAKLKLMEGTAIKKKYTRILDMLNEDRVTYSNKLDSLKSQILEQCEEVERLETVQQTALNSRDAMRAIQQ